MSEMETHKGKLVPMMLNGVTMEERAQHACNILGYENDCYDSWMECLEDNGCGSVFVRGDIIYKVEDEELDPYGFAEATLNEDGTIDYFLHWYNGGGGFEEVLDAAIKDDSTD